MVSRLQSCTSNASSLQRGAGWHSPKSVTMAAAPKHLTHKVASAVREASADRRAGESHLSQDNRDCAADAARDEPGHLQSPLITCLSMHLVMASGRDSIPVTYVTRIWIPSHSARAVTAKPHSTQSTQTALQSRYPHPKEVRETDLYIPIAGRKTTCTA